MTAPTTAQVLANAAQTAAERQARINKLDATIRHLAHACEPITTTRTTTTKRGA